MQEAAISTGLVAGQRNSAVQRMRSHGCSFLLQYPQRKHWDCEDVEAIDAPFLVPAPPVAPRANTGEPLSEALLDRRAAFAEADTTEYIAEIQQPEVSLDAEAIICSYGWDCSTALYVARLESGSDFTAGANYLGCVGTFQLHPVHHWRFYQHGWDPYTYDIAQNTAIAYELWLTSGWAPWGL